MPRNRSLLTPRAITFRANAITQRILRDLRQWYETHTIGPKPVTQTAAILAGLWDAYNLRIARTGVLEPPSQPGPERPRKRNRRPA